MKTLLLTLAFIAFSASTRADIETTNGFLVFEIDRYTYAGGTKGNSEIKQSFKIPLTREFLSNFKTIPGLHSMGTGFVCRGGNLKPNDGTTFFMWWIRKTADHRWSINMWGEGVEMVNGVKLQSRDPDVSQYLTIRRWEDLDMTYVVSCVNKNSGINISFSAKYMTAEDMKTASPIPAASVRKDDGSLLFQGDNQSTLPMKIDCSFQEG